MAGASFPKKSKWRRRVSGVGQRTLGVVQEAVGLDSGTEEKD